MALFISDIDGTLLNPERKLSSVTEATIRRATNEGHTFVLCSSRPPSSMRGLEAVYGGGGVPLIAYNGGFVVNSAGSVVLDVPIDPAVAMAIYAECERLDLHCSFYSGEDWFVWGDDKWAQRETENTAVSPNAELAREYAESGRLAAAPPHKIMCMGDPELIDQVEQMLGTNDQTVTYRSKDTYLEIANAMSSKGAAVAMVADELGVPLEDVHYFGDNYNDLSAFEVVGTSIAVANAKQEVLDAADVITERHHDDGVAVYLASQLAN